MFPRWNPKIRCLLQSRPERTEGLLRTIQTFGTPGWISLLPGEVKWIPREGSPEVISAVVDDRLCCGTLLRAERLTPTR